MIKLAPKKRNASKTGTPPKSWLLSLEAKAKSFHESGRMEKADPHQTTSGQRDDFVCWIVACHGVVYDSQFLCQWPGWTLLYPPCIWDYLWVCHGVAVPYVEQRSRFAEVEQQMLWTKDETRIGYSPALQRSIRMLKAVAHALSPALSQLDSLIECWE